MSRYESPIYRFQIAFGEDAHIKRNLFFHQTTHFASIRDPNPIYGSQLPMGSIVKTPFIEMKPSSEVYSLILASSGKVLVDMSKCIVANGLARH